MVDGTYSTTEASKKSSSVVLKDVASKRIKVKPVAATNNTKAAPVKPYDKQPTRLNKTSELVPIDHKAAQLKLAKISKEASQNHIEMLKSLPNLSDIKGSFVKHAKLSKERVLTS